MHFTTDKKSFGAIIAAAASIVERRTTIPIIQHVLLTAKDGAITVQGTDLERETVASISADVLTPGQTTVSAQVLADVVNRSRDGSEIEFKLDPKNGRANIVAGRGKFALATLSPGDFPKMPAPADMVTFQIAGSELFRMFDITRFAISMESTRYYLCGVYLHLPSTTKGATLCAVSTDGHKLAKVTSVRPDGVSDIPGIIVPRKTVGEIAKMVPNDTTEVTVGISSTLLTIAVGTTRLVSKLIDGTFPDYGRVIPQDNAIIARIDAKDMIGAMERVLATTDERAPLINLTLGSRITVSAGGADHSGIDEVDGEYDGKDISIGFNGRYMIEVLSNITETAQFLIRDASSPIVVKDAGDDTKLFVVMPMKRRG